ncbi:MAG: autoinducer binding domain-containing protein [Desulfobacterales bacterium]|nr:autoinducer binding domain-containing protein [Desulfobacterales bacterium]
MIHARIPDSIMDASFELMEDSFTVEDIKGITALMRKTENLMDADHSVCVLGTMAQCRVIDFALLLNISFPDEWVELYTSQKYNRVDPIVDTHLKTFSPQLWSETYQRCAAIDPAFIHQSRDFKLVNGITYGLPAPGKDISSLFSFSRESSAVPSHTAGLAKILVPYLHNALVRVYLNNGRAKTPAGISGREKEVLKWIGKGKTNWEISVILGISERTVKFHVTNILKKLDAATRSQAMAVAWESGILP